jgi:protein associated with RNAse G/E
MKLGEDVSRIKVQKKNPAGDVTYQYEGDLVRRDENTIVLNALFDRRDMPFQDIVFKTGDRFVEFYYSDRWYNIFEIHDRDDGQIKGWYCNVGMPAVFEEGIVSYVDLALDLWVSSNGNQTVLDEDEFAQLGLEEEVRAGAMLGLQELRLLFESKNPPL